MKTNRILIMLATAALGTLSAQAFNHDDNSAYWKYVWVGGASGSYYTDTNWNIIENEGSAAKEGYSGYKPVGADVGYIGYTYSVEGSTSVFTRDDSTEITVTGSPQAKELFVADNVDITLGSGASEGWPAGVVHLGKNTQITGSDNGLEALWSLDFSSMDGTASVTMGNLYLRQGWGLAFTGNHVLSTESFSYTLMSANALKTPNLFSLEEVSADFNMTDMYGNSLLYAGVVNDADSIGKGLYGIVVTGGTDTSALSFELVAHSVPEPTTATLSLLALAGLAARRRRK